MAIFKGHSIPKSDGDANRTQAIVGRLPSVPLQASRSGGGRVAVGGNGAEDGRGGTRPTIFKSVRTDSTPSHFKAGTGGGIGKRGKVGRGGTVPTNFKSVRTESTPSQNQTSVTASFYDNKDSENLDLPALLVSCWSAAVTRQKGYVFFAWLSDELASAIEKAKDRTAALSSSASSADPQNVESHRLLANLRKRRDRRMHRLRSKVSTLRRNPPTTAWPSRKPPLHSRFSDREHGLKASAPRAGRRPGITISRGQLPLPPASC